MPLPYLAPGIMWLHGLGWKWCGWVGRHEKRKKKRKEGKEEEIEAAKKLGRGKAEKENKEQCDCRHQLL